MKSSREPLIFLVLAGGFATMAFEVKQLHGELLDHAWQPHLPIYYCFLAVAASLIGMAAHRGMRVVSSIIFVLGIAVGLFGLYNHSGGEVGKIIRPFTDFMSNSESEDREREDNEGRRKKPNQGPPPLAPAGICGLSAIGLILAVPSRGKKLAP